MQIRQTATKVVTGIVTLANANIHNPIKVKNGKEIYTATIIIPKSDRKTIVGINTAIENAIVMGASKHRGTFAKRAKENSPIYDGDSEMLSSVFNDTFVINAGSLTKPYIYDLRMNIIEGETVIGSGSKVRVSLTFFPYLKSGVCTVGCKLGNIQQAGSERNRVEFIDSDFDKFLKDFGLILDVDG